jgi:hypothetical protein
MRDKFASTSRLPRSHSKGSNAWIGNRRLPRTGDGGVLGVSYIQLQLATKSGAGAGNWLIIDFSH